MARWLAAVAFICAVPASARADAEVLDSLEAVHEACGSARDAGRARLFEIEVEGGWRFRTARDGVLVVDTGRNFRALDDRVSLLVPREEHLGFEVADGGEALRRAAGRLRVGFFLAFDDRHRQPCLVRNRFAVTIVRADVAYLELVDGSGARLARTETDRLSAWQDAVEDLAIAGEGPRGAVGSARFGDGSAPPPTWQAALPDADTRARIGQCPAEGLQRGAAPDGQVVVRLNVETRTGRIRRADVALSSVGDDAEAECIARALGATATLPPGPATWTAPVVDLSVPVRVVSD